MNRFNPRADEVRDYREMAQVGLEESRLVLLKRNLLEECEKLRRAPDNVAVHRLIEVVEALIEEKL